MKHVLLAFVLLITSSAFAQTKAGSITGIVVGENESLELASVLLLKTSYSVTTNSKGYFEINNLPAGNYQVRIGYIGYENYQQEVTVIENAATEIKAELIPLTSKLKEIVVTGTLKEVTKLQSVTPVDVYTTKYFQRNPALTLHQTLANMNGIFPDIDNGVSNTTDVQINGLEGNYTMFLIDGVPVMNGLAGNYALDATPIAMVDKMEILKGASSTLYGSEAIAGVIHLKTKDPATAPRLSLNAYFDSKLTANIDLTATAKLKKVNALFSISGAASNYRWDIDGNNFIDMPLTNRANFYNKWSFVRKENRIGIIYARYLFEERVGGEMNLRYYERGYDRTYSEALNTHQWQTGFQYQFPIKDKLLLLADYSEHRQEAFFGVNKFNGIQRTGFSQLTWSKKVDKHNELLIGASYRLNYYADNTGLSVDSNTEGSKFNHIAGVFMEDEISIHRLHKLLLGVRFDYSSQAGPAFSPRLNYKWNSKDENNVIRIGVGTGYRVPNLMNEGFGALNGSRQVLVEEKLKPEVAINANANYTRVQKVKGGVLNIDASVFYTYFFNRIEPDYNDDPELIIYSNNTNGAMASGFSINADFTFSYPLKVGVGLTYTNVFEFEVEDDGEIEKEIPSHVPPLVANFYLSYNFPVPQLSIDWTGNLVAPMLLTAVPNDYRPDYSAWHTIQNIQLTKKFKSGLELYMGIKNLFNYVQKDPILRPNDPFNKNVTADNPFNYRFDTTYGFTSTEGIKGFVGLRYVLQ
jgi:outer membrane receptor for ferrienterochelin and colicins